MEVKGHLPWVTVFRSYLPCFLRQALSQGLLCSPVRLGWLSNNPPASSCLCLQSTRTTSKRHCKYPAVGALGVKLRSSYLHWLTAISSAPCPGRFWTALSLGLSGLAPVVLISLLQVPHFPYYPTLENKVHSYHNFPITWKTSWLTHSFLPWSNLVSSWAF